jgi:hypothetical protein
VVVARRRLHLRPPLVEAPDLEREEPLHQPDAEPVPAGVVDSLQGPHLLERTSN